MCAVFIFAVAALVVAPQLMAQRGGGGGGAARKVDAAAVVRDAAELEARAEAAELTARYGFATWGLR
jgi:hypothetical protein